MNFSNLVQRFQDDPNWVNKSGGRTIRAKVDRPRPTSADLGRPRPTSVDLGRPRPTSADLTSLGSRPAVARRAGARGGAVESGSQKVQRECEKL
eukprot:7388534-Prymnesium_polylepis.1